MYHIDTSKDKVAFDGLVDIAEELAIRGFRVNKNIDEMESKYAELADEYKLKLRNEYGIENPNSTKQLCYKLKELADEVPSGDRNIIVEKCLDPVTNKWTSSAEAMESLSDNGIQFATYLLEYRNYIKRTQVIASLKKQMTADMIVHPEVGIGGTGRVSFAEPAVMNIHKDILWDILCPMGEGNALFSVDIKNQEPHILIELTGCETLKPALRAEEGIYEYMMEQAFKPRVKLNVIRDKSLSKENTRVFAEDLSATYPISLCTTEKVKTNGYTYKGVKVVAIEKMCYNIVDNEGDVTLPDKATVMLDNRTTEEVEIDWGEVKDMSGVKSMGCIEGVLKGIEFTVLPIERKEFKTCWIAMSYGAGYNVIVSSCYSLDPHAVYDFIANVDGIKRYRSLCKQHAAKHPDFIRTAFGTKIPLGETPRHKLEKYIMNYPIQGTGADILKCLVKHFNEERVARGIGDNMTLYLIRHDEVVIEVDKGYLAGVGIDEVIHQLRDIFEHQINDWDPFKIEINKVV